MSDKKLNIGKFERLTAIPFMLIFGTATVVSSKFIFESTAPNRHGEDKAFKKPWFMDLMMFLGMLSCLIVYLYQKYTKKVDQKNVEEKSPLVQDASHPVQLTFWKKYKEYFQILPPAMCDLISTGIMYIGFLFVPASVFQLMRGSMVLFSAIVARIFLKKHIQRFHTLAIVVVMIGLCLVGLACVSADSSGGSETHTAGEEIFGLTLIVLSQLIQASQIVIEQYLLHDCTMAPALIVGTEGFWGTVVMIFFVLPIFQVIPGCEDTYDTFIQLKHSSALIIGIVFYIIVILFYNLYGMRVTQQYSAVHRTILEAVRTGCIWIVQLFIYYAITKDHGEKWSNWSFVELLGFVFILLGTFIYNEVIKIPSLRDAPPPAQFSKAEVKPSESEAK